MRKLLAMCAVAIMSIALAFTADARGFGVKAGMNLTSLDFKAGLPPTLGYSAGVTWQLDLPLGFAIQPDLLYNVKASRLSDINSEVLGLGYLELPVNIQWGLRFAQKNIRVFAQASPFLGYAVTQSGDLDAIRAVNTQIDGALSSDGADKWTSINRFSYGAGLGLGVQLWRLQVTAQYTWNLGKLADIRDTSLSNFNDKNFGGCVVSVALLLGKE